MLGVTVYLGFWLVVGVPARGQGQGAISDTAGRTILRLALVRRMLAGAGKPVWGCGVRPGAAREVGQAPGCGHPMAFPPQGMALVRVRTAGSIKGTAGPPGWWARLIRDRALRAAGHVHAAACWALARAVSDRTWPSRMA